MTNFEKLQKMPPELLAAWIVEKLNACPHDRCPFLKEDYLKSAWYIWLQTEAEE